MIEKKISYDINIEKPSKTKPVKQGGVLNYLGKQKTVNAPIHWRSSPKHPIAHLSYITKDEEKILIDLNLYGSLKGKPNKGPFGLPSLQGSGGGAGGDGGGDGGSSGGDSGDAGDSGPGGSDDGTGHGGPGPGDDGGVGQASEGTNATAADAAAANAAAADAANQASEGTNATAAAAAAATEAAQAAQSTTGITGITNAISQAVQNAISNPVSTAIGVVAGPVAGMVANAISNAVSAANRGVTGPSDDTQETSSVQSGPAQDSSGGGITTIPMYAPLTNVSTGDNLVDALMARYRAYLGTS